MTDRIIVGADGRKYITTEQPQRSMAEDRLTAAAPDLLAALKAVEPILCRMYGQQADDLPPVKTVRAAIAKAEGEK